MSVSRSLGITLFRPTSQSLLQAVQQAEAAGVPMAWVPSEPVGPDALTTLAVAAANTQQINLGTGITVTYTRHPLTLANQVLTVAELAPQRFRLGIGVSHPFVVESMYGVPFQKPINYLREYVNILRNLLWTGEVHHHGDNFNVEAQLPLILRPPKHQSCWQLYRKTCLNWLARFQMARWSPGDCCPI
ncbi:LLM class flavin-dependent oxidoreductase [Dictyobacter kobayashii]|uniref:Luciferase-like domain-containing protein n=1 Tax=Dictyobacter kobayashii TaxID=2014872 RepID=A0A402AZ63_9CHLR|nr:LLM class flavin-dependent oxidoreductase [Dictyobacter kobayashii]GCE24399.1 hypothetical protein KDK_81990 [Dictyobacter kobayashii]